MKYYVEEKEEDVDEEVVVRAARIKKEAVETRIRTEEARKVPGTQGDTLKVVQNLPGVGRASFGSGQLVVWGSSPKETRVNRRRRGDSRPCTTWAACARRSIPIWSSRSISRPGRMARTMDAAWAGWCASSWRQLPRVGRARLRRRRHPGHLGRGVGRGDPAAALRRRRTASATSTV